MPSEADSNESHAPLSNRGARQIVQLVVILIGLWWLVRSLRSVLLLFALVFLVAMVLNPLVVWLQKRRVRRGVSVALILIGVLGAAVLIGMFAIPPLLNELQDLIKRAPGAWQSIRSGLENVARRYPSFRSVIPQADEIASAVGAKAGDFANVLLKSTIGFVGGVFSAVLALLLLIFVLANPRPLVLGYLAMVPTKTRPAARRTLERFMRQVSGWARGVLINGAITGVTTGTLLWLIGVQPALVFGAFTFLGELLPTVGPVIMAFPILFVALSLGMTKFWLALAVILFVQQVETTVLVPYVFGRELQLNPVMILFFTLATASLFGIIGAILALPCAALVQILIDEFYLRPRRLNYNALEKDAGRIVAGERASSSGEFLGEA